MKKVLLILALVAVYGVSISNASTNVISVEKSKVTVVADNSSDLVLIQDQDGKKEAKKEAKKACCGDKATAKKAAGEKPSTGCSDAQKKSCAASGKTCGDAKATTEKKACCGEKKK